MPRIQFTADPKLPADMRHLGFKKGMTVELSEDHCERWIRRNCATYVTAAKPVQSAPAEPVAPAEDAPIVAPVAAPVQTPRRFGRPRSERSGGSSN
jgi:hypothetical protein